MKKIILILAICFAIFLTACGGGSTETSTETSPNTNTTTETKTDDAKSDDAKSDDAKPDDAKKDETASSESSEGVTGVPACDEYISKVEKLMENDKVPQQVRDTYKKTLEQNRTAWKQAASNPQTKATLDSSCKTAMDSMKPVFEQYGVN